MHIRSYRPFLLALVLVLLVALSAAPARAGPPPPDVAPTATSAATPPADYLTACAATPPPASCFTIDGFIDTGVGQRTSWVLINESDAPASFSFYLYDQTDAVTLDEIVGTETISAGEVFIYPGPFRAPITSPNPLTGVFTSTAAMTLQVVGPTTRCARVSGAIACAEVRVPPGAATYGFYNFEANPDIVWVHQLYLDGVPQAPYSDIMSGPEVKHYPTDISGGVLRVQGAALPPPRFKALAHPFTGGPFPPHFMGWKMRFPIARR